MKSESIAAIAKALSAAQGEMHGAVKSEVNPAFKRDGKISTYATLADVWDAIREPFANHGLSVTQTTRITEGGNVICITTLLHSSGEWIAGEYPISPVMNTPQSLGASMTFGRRFSLMAIAGIAPVDDDGNEASKKDEPEKKAKPAAPKAEAPTPSPTKEVIAGREKMVAAIMDQAAKHGISKEDLVEHVQQRWQKSSKDLSPRELGELLDFVSAVP
jgi:hypothetical protein